MNVTIKDIIYTLKKEDVLVDFYNIDDTQIEIRDVCYDSRQVIKGSAFVCKGIYFEEKYLIDAIKKGAYIYK